MSGINNVTIFIDGYYLNKNIRDKSDGIINYSKLADYLNTQARFNRFIGPILNRVFYYDGKPDLKDVDLFEPEKQTEAKQKIESALKIQDEELDKIRNVDSFDVRLGHAVLSGNMEFRQKGVDLMIGIDMITQAYDKQYNVAVLVAGDSDFIELVNAVKYIGPKVIGAYFDHNIRKELTNSFDKRFVLTIDQLRANGIIEEQPKN